MKRKILLYFAIASIVLLVLPVFNYTVDIARVFSKDYKKHYKNQLSNELFLQSYYLLYHPEFTKILFGSSRVGNGLDLTTYSGWYKAWHQGANIEEHLNTLKFLLYKNKKIDEVKIAVDYLSFFYVTNNNDYFRQNPPIGLRNTIEFYKFYLFRKPDKKDIENLRKDRLVSNRNHIFSNIAQEYSKDNDYFKNIDMFNLNKQVTLKNIDKNIKALSSIKELCEQNGIKFSFFINPFHYKNYYAQNIDTIKLYKKELASIDNYYDCSLGINDFTTNSKYWVDVSHYNKELGNLILDKVMTNKESSLCQNVTDENIDKLNSTYLKSNFDLLIKNALNDIKLIPNDSYFNKKIYHKDINNLQNIYTIKNIEMKDKLENNIFFLKLKFSINKPTKLTIQVGDDVLEQTIQESKIWPAVSQNQTVGFFVDKNKLLSNDINIKSNNQIEFQTIEILTPREGL